VHFIDHIDLVACLGGAKGNLVTDRVAHIVHTCVRRCVHLDQIQQTSVVDRPANVTLVAGTVGQVLVQAVHGFGQQTGHRRLARAARPRKEISVRGSPGPQSVLERRRHVFLSNDVLEPLRSPLEVQCLRSHLTLHQE
jgi:hypothetical protein